MGEAILIKEQPGIVRPIVSSMKYETVLNKNNWNSNSNGYTQTVQVKGIHAGDVPLVSLIQNSDNNTKLLQEWEYVSKISVEEESITATCYKKQPTQDLMIQLVLNYSGAEGHVHSVNELTGTTKDSLLIGSDNNTVGEITIEQLKSRFNLSTNDISNILEMFTTYAKADHTHNTSEITGLDIELDKKSNTGHEHAISDITSLENTLNEKATNTHNHTLDSLNGLLSLTKGGTGVDSLESLKTLLGLGGSSGGTSYEVGPITKVNIGSYKGTGTTQTINAGFPVKLLIILGFYSSTNNNVYPEFGIFTQTRSCGRFGSGQVNDNLIAGGYVKWNSNSILQIESTIFNGENKSMTYATYVWVAFG